MKNHQSRNDFPRCNSPRLHFQHFKKLQNKTDNFLLQRGKKSRIGDMLFYGMKLAKEVISLPT